jgi:hypothetical protein
VKSIVTEQPETQGMVKDMVLVSSPDWA